MWHRRHVSRVKFEESYNVKAPVFSEKKFLCTDKYNLQSEGQVLLTLLGRLFQGLQGEISPTLWVPYWPSWLVLQPHLPKGESFPRCPCHAKELLRRCHFRAEGILFFPHVQILNVSVSSWRSAADTIRGNISMAVASALAGEAGWNQMQAKLSAGQLTRRKTPFSSIYPQPGAAGGLPPPQSRGL